MSEIVHLRINADGDSFAAFMADESWMVYWFETDWNCPVRQHRWIEGEAMRRGEVEALSNNWQELLAKAEAHPMNWQNKIAARQALEREQEAVMHLITEVIHEE